MKKAVPPEVFEIYKKLEIGGFEVYFVGGCVRDYLLENKIKDWDLTTNAKPEEMQKIFPHSFYDNTFGTVGIPIVETDETRDVFEKNYVEVTTFRKESGYKNLRHPEKIEWGKTVEEDLSRRDFTMNAVAAKIEKDETRFIDPFNGMQDLEKRIIRTVGDPNERFGEDALRLLRAIRFASQLNFEIEENTWKALLKNAKLIAKISAERIRDEFIKTLGTDRAYEGVVLLDQSGMLDVIIPELSEGKEVSQARPGRHHTTDVFTHNLLSLKHCPSKNPIVKLATLLHDIGKPYVAGKDGEGHVIFYNHEVKGAQIAKEIAEKLRLSKKEREKIVVLIRWHMFTVDEHITDSAIRRFIRRVGVENVSDMMDLRIGDRLGGGTQVAESWRLKKFKERVAEQLNPPFSINDLAVDGNDIMQELKIEPGPKVGGILQKLFEEVDEDLSKNNREYLLSRIKKLNN